MNVTLQNHLSQHPAQAAAHLTPEVWAQANRLLLRKAIAEYAHEIILEPEHPVSYTHLTLPTSAVACRSRWSPYH